MIGNPHYKHKSVNQKRKEKEEREQAKAKLPKLDSYFVRLCPPVAVNDNNSGGSDSSGLAPRPAMPGAAAGLRETTNHNIR